MQDSPIILKIRDNNGDLILKDELLKVKFSDLPDDCTMTVEKDGVEYPTKPPDFRQSYGKRL